jgi:hypothetical protein
MWSWKWLYRCRCIIENVNKNLKNKFEFSILITSFWVYIFINRIKWENVLRHQSSTWQLWWRETGCQKTLPNFYNSNFPQISLNYFQKIPFKYIQLNLNDFNTHQNYCFNVLSLFTFGRRRQTLLKKKNWAYKRQIINFFGAKDSKSQLYFSSRERESWAFHKSRKNPEEKR